MYADRISRISNLTMDAVIDNCMQYLPSEFKYRPYTHPELAHGLSLLQSEEGLDCYIGAYGEMHQAKCRAAMQNMPFPPDEGADRSLSLEIVDWGCGQAIGTICLVDYLKERELTRWLKKITLIEPSEAALNRAFINAVRATNKGVPIETINKFLPSKTDDNEDFVINYRCRFVFHIFSNIIDVNNIDLAKLSKCIEAPGHTHYILCTGPLNANAFRIDRFCEIFSPEQVFSDISSPKYGRTKSTNYYFTCKTKGFVYRGEPLDLSNYDSEEKAEEPVFDEYDIRLQNANNVFSKTKGRVYFRLNNILSQNDLLYLAPDINGMSPDFMIIRPNVGIAVISVFDEDLSLCSCDAENKKFIIKPENLSDEVTEMQSPLETLNTYQSLILESNRALAEAVAKDNRNLGLVKKVLICSNGTEEQAKDLFKNSGRITIYGSDFITDAKVSKGFFNNINLIYPNCVFSDTALSQLKRDLASDWHSYREGVPVTLSRSQAKLSVSAEKQQRKISGIAGSGKTQVLAIRAVNAQIRTGGDVLVLTFNITLVNYMRMRLGQVRADFPWNKIQIDHYHRFFRKHANANNLKVKYESYDDENFFKTVESELPKYDAIFVDEVQDYTTAWLRIVRKYFLKQNGEFVVFGDPKQNIYHRPVDAQENINLGVIPGVWNKELSDCNRFKNPALFNLAYCFQSYFGLIKEFPKNPGNEHTAISEFQFNMIEYKNINPSGSFGDTASEVYNVCNDFINRSKTDVKNIVILASRTDILKELDYKYRQVTGKETTVTFVSKENEESVWNVNGHDSFKYKKDIDRLEKVEKNRFTMETDYLKLSTVQSFKGWEANTVICIIQNALFGDDRVILSPELIYTGITRARENLLVINLNNLRYHDFFNDNIR